MTLTNIFMFDFNMSTTANNFIITIDCFIPNLTAGKATIEVEGLDNYTGKKIVSFTIKKYDPKAKGYYHQHQFFQVY